MSIGNVIGPGVGGVAGRAPGGDAEFGIKVKTAWPTTFFMRKWREHDKHAPGIIEHLQQLKGAASQNIESGIAPGAKSEAGLYESRLDLFETTQHVGIRALAAFIDETIRDVVSGVNGRKLAPDQLRVEFTDSWCHITNDSGFHDAHYHGGCSWCGIYYLQSGDTPSEKPAHAGNGVNRFYSPIAIGGLSEDYGNSYLSSCNFDIPPRDGLLFVFPSYILHAGLPYTGGRDRVIISFNSKTHVK